MSAIDLLHARAHWLTRDLLAVPGWVVPDGAAVDDLGWSLAVAPDGGLDPTAPAEELALTVEPGSLPAASAATHPHLVASGARPLRLAAGDAARAEELLRGQVALLGRRGGRSAVATSLQVAGVLDDLYADRAAGRPLGPTWAVDGSGARVPTVTVWAPTASRVELLLWDGVPEVGDDRAWSPSGVPTVLPMGRHDDGTWSLTGTAAWADRCYQLQLHHVCPRTGEQRTVRSTDPWSVALALGSTHSVLVDLADGRWAPPGWRSRAALPTVRPVDHVLYEAHVRDLTRDDPGLPSAVRGTYLGLSQDSSTRRHLRELAEAGLTTVHLLPLFDLSSVEEDPALRIEPDVAELARLSAADPGGERQQQLVTATAGRDAFNWGYDPWHVLAPEGSYATSPGAAHGGARVRQCRTLVDDLHALGLRVVLDQVYNHSADSGLHRASVLDRVVPGYYHRLDEHGRVETSTCCQNLATEHAFARRLMVEGCVLWARHYRVDGFRFDLMGHHSRGDLEAVRAALAELTVAKDGVDGPGLLLYGEGWNFGEVADNARFHQAVQGQLDGVRVATFDDRLRDAIRGGSVLDDDPRAGLGLATGGSDARIVDHVQVGLTGALRAVTFRSQQTGLVVRGDELRYGDAPVGYAAEPGDAVAYVDAHDNETLFDTLALKLPPGTPMALRVRHTLLALAAVTLSQGIPFWHAGVEVLRSKSLDRNSYDSGDWFNRLDYRGLDNGFGRGLPPAPDNRRHWPVMAPLLRDPALRPGPADVAATRAGALDLLRIRAGLPLLRLGSAAAVLRQVSFPVSGLPHGRPDTVVMLIEPTESIEPLEPGGVLVVLGAATSTVDQHLPSLVGQRWSLCAVQQEGADPVVRQTRWDPEAAVLTLPGLTAAVLVRG